jgi:hypothetical protein
LQADPTEKLEAHAVEVDGSLPLGSRRWLPVTLTTPRSSSR